jgi:hypothetical protein
MICLKKKVVKLNNSKFDVELIDFERKISSQTETAVLVKNPKRKY